jgi:purine-binding chemotaxis protein CheW
MDIRRRFLMEECDYNDRTCIIVINLLGNSIGLIVDSVSEVITLGEGALTKATEFHGGQNSKYVKSIGRADNSIILLLECETLVLDSVIDALHEIV